MSTYFVAPDHSNGELYVWSEEYLGDQYPLPVVRQFPLPHQSLWDKLTFGMEIRP